MENLKAGPELNALVAEKVMGLPVKQFADGTWLQDDGSAIEPYSTDIAAAWEVVKRTRNTVGQGFAVIECSSYEIGWWIAGWFDWREGPYEHEKSARAETAPFAICKAALKAVEG